MILLFLDNLKYNFKCLIRNLFLLTHIPILLTERNYSRKIKSLKCKEKINIIFLVNNNTKWNGDSLYKKLDANNYFYPVVLVIVPKNNDYIDNIHYQFFQKRGYRVFTVSCFNDIIKHKPDIIFFQEPWFTFKFKNNFSLLRLSKYSLCMYFHYSITPNIVFSEIWKKSKYFYKLLFKHFVYDQDCSNEFKYLGVNNTVITGHPILDVYSEPVKKSIWRNPQKYKIIYAPHHSFSNNSLKWATFEWNGKEILKKAIDNPDTEWIFKPHPWFRNFIVKYGIMKKQEIDDYFNSWEQIGQVYLEGDYFDIFRTSDLLITDCGGFLTQYLPTKNPVIHLISSNGEKRSSIGDKSSQNYYKANNMNELNNIFDMLVNKKEDPLKEKRLLDASKILLNSSDNIINELQKEIKP